MFVSRVLKPTRHVCSLRTQTKCIDRSSLPRPMPEIGVSVVRRVRAPRRRQRAPCRVPVGRFHRDVASSATRFDALCKDIISSRAFSLLLFVFYCCEHTGRNVNQYERGKREKCLLFPLQFAGVIEFRLEIIAHKLGISLLSHLRNTRRPPL